MAQLINPEEIEVPQKIAVGDNAPRIHNLTRFDKPRLNANSKPQVSAEQVESAEIIDIFRVPNKVEIKDEWED